MSTYKHAIYESPIDLPERESGKVKITHRFIEKGEELTVVSMRQAFTRGINSVGGKAPWRWKVHQLSEEGLGVWMTDLPEELNQIQELVHDVRPYGRVLIGGLGLGILATVCAKLANEVVVVETNPDVITLCENPDLFTTVEDDIRRHLENSDSRYDFYLLDTWQGTSEFVWWETVLPLRRAVRHRHGPKPVIHCWAEDIMCGQIVRALQLGKDHWYYKGLPAMTVGQALYFMRDVGLPTWEKRWGAIVDANMKEEA